MKALFDENLSSKLCKKLSDIFPLSTHVKNIKLEEENDLRIWEYAKANDYMIISKDSDFIDMYISDSNPPKTIWLRCGNVKTEVIEQTLRSNFIKIKSFFDDRENFLLILK